MMSSPRRWLLFSLTGALLGFLIGGVTCGVHNDSNFFHRQEQATVYVAGIPVHQKTGPVGTSAAVATRWLPYLIGCFTVFGLFAGLAASTSKGHSVQGLSSNQ
jgi:hypothetical protein